MTDVALFPLLSNYLDVSRQSVPQYLGQHSGIDALPDQYLPPIYWWADTLQNRTVLAFNGPLLEMICVEQAAAKGLAISHEDPRVAEAISTLMSVVKPTFEFFLEHLEETFMEDFWRTGGEC